MKYPWILGSSILIIFVAMGCAHRTVTKQVTEPASETKASDESRLHEVVVKQAVMDYVSGDAITPVIILANKENDRQILPIWVGIFEGVSINMALNKKVSERPGTHDLFVSVLGQFHTKLIKVVVTDLRNNTYIAAMTMESHGQIKEIDARPSDAIALALRCVAPIYVSENVIHKGGWIEVPKPEEEQPEQDTEEIKTEKDDQRL